MSWWPGRAARLGTGPPLAGTPLLGAKAAPAGGPLPDGCAGACLVQPDAHRPLTALVGTTSVLSGRRVMSYAVGSAIANAAGGGVDDFTHHRPDHMQTSHQAGCGLDRANWTDEELATYLYQTKGLTVSATTIRTFYQRHGVRL